jgi:hypothetical protein
MADRKPWAVFVSDREGNQRLISGGYEDPDDVALLFDLLGERGYAPEPNLRTREYRDANVDEEDRHE